MAPQDSKNQDQTDGDIADTPGDAATGVGAMLMATRLRIGEDLRDVAKALHIRFIYLQAIEAGRYGDLPGAAYALGFIRSYSEYLGLDSAEVVRRFKNESATVKSHSSRLVFPVPIPESSVPGGAIVFIGFVLAVLAYGGWYVSTVKDGFLVELISPLPERLNALLPDDEKSQPAPKQTPVTTEETPRDSTESGITEPKTASPTPEQSSGPAPEPAPESAEPVEKAVEIVQKAAEPVAEPIIKPVVEPVIKPVVEPVIKPVVEPVIKPVVEPVIKPVIKPVVEPVAPVAEMVAQPSAKLAEPAADFTPPAPANPPATPPATPPAAATEAVATVTETATVAPVKEPEPTVTQTPGPTSAAKIDASATPTPDKAPVTEVATRPATEPQGRVYGVEDSQFRIEVKALKNSWIQVRDDAANTLILTRLLRSGDSYRVPDRPGLKLLTGNAGALEILVDGNAVPPIGDSGAVRRSVALDPDRLVQGQAVE